VRRLRRLGERPGRFDIGVEGHGDDRQSFRRELFVECLPPGQVKSAASIRCPGDEHHLSTPESGEVELVASEVG
jgi:hypothetical protein